MFIHHHAAVADKERRQRVVRRKEVERLGRATIVECASTGGLDRRRKVVGQQRAQLGALLRTEIVADAAPPTSSDRLHAC